MAFLRNAWYAAAWNEELGTTALARTLLGEPLLLYRDSAGAPVALADQCPHRFAPLSLGKINGDRVSCPYHGLTFDKSGACVHNPHGRGARPASLSVRCYPTAVQNEMIWLWMGEPGEPASSPPPDYEFLRSPNSRVIHGYLHVGANYQLVTDNLMDLSHAEFLHPFIAPPGTSAAIEFRAAQDGERVTAFHSMPDQPNTPLMSLLFHTPPQRIDGRAHMHWQPPAIMYLDVGATEVGQPESAGVCLPQLHLLSPETQSSTHYFWVAAHASVANNDALTEMLRAGLDEAFRNEDEPIIRAVQARMRDRPLFDLAPALLPMDEAAIRARRILEKKITGEQARLDVKSGATEV
jgi:phenylpropionate dioxygenase-like ring-hydroxylating dioxygenase large terminal subunit